VSKRPPIRIFDEWRIKKTMTDRLALKSAERAFRALGRGVATVPAPLSWDFPKVNGEVHIKGARLHSSELFTFKVATGFYGNVELGIPTGAGFVLIFDASTGFPRGILADNGYLTDLRTAAAGALAASYLTEEKPLSVAILGSGVQGQLQYRLLQLVREIASIRVWSRTPPRAQRWRSILHEAGRTDARAFEEVSDAVEEADLVITATPSRSPILHAGMLKPGATVIAVGSDGEGKQEVDSTLVAGADKLVTDLTAQCVRLGELQHAVKDGLMSTGNVYSELGAIVLERVPGRESDEAIVCDLTGVGAQDAAIGELAFIELAGEDDRGS